MSISKEIPQEENAESVPQLEMIPGGPSAEPEETKEERYKRVVASAFKAAAPKKESVIESAKKFAQGDVQKEAMYIKTVEQASPKLDQATLNKSAETFANREYHPEVVPPEVVLDQRDFDWQSIDEVVDMLKNIDTIPALEERKKILKSIVTASQKMGSSIPPAYGEQALSLLEKIQDEELAARVATLPKTITEPTAKSTPEIIAPQKKGFWSRLKFW